MSTYKKGIAFIFEGPTEKIFYLSIIEMFCKENNAYKNKYFNAELAEFEYLLTLPNHEKIILKTNTVNSINNITNSEAWIKSMCINRYNDILWTIFLCYDADSTENSIRQFNEGNWKQFKNNLNKENIKVIDFRAVYDIESLMFLDEQGICNFLGILKIPKIRGLSGKQKMKRLFRMNNQFYHEGDRAKSFIKKLDKKTIVSKSSLPFDELKKICFDK